MQSKVGFNRFRILTVVSDLKKGGAQRAALNFADGYCELGHDSKVLALNSGGIREIKLRSLGIDYWILLSKKNLTKIKKWNPEIIHLHTTGIKFDQVKKLKIYFPNAQLIEKNVFSIPSEWQNLLTMSFQMSIWCAWKYMLCNKSNVNIVSVVPNPVKTSDFKRSENYEILQLKKDLNIPVNNVLIGRVGQSYLGKWSLLLIKIFEDLCKRFDYISLILVDPPIEIKLKAKSSIYNKKIRIINAITDDKYLNVIYSAVDIFALIADQGESFGNVLAESMLCETPAVVLSTPWCDNSQCEVVGNNVGGLVTLTPKGFELALIKLIQNIDLRKTLGKRGRKKVISCYDYKYVSRTVLDKLNDRKIDNFFKINTSTIISIYCDSFDKSNLFTLNLIRFNFLISLTRISSGYQSIVNYLKRYLKIIFNKIYSKYLRQIFN